MSDLDYAYPQGQPASPTCRVCRGNRWQVGFGIVACVTCDLIPAWPRAKTSR